MAEHEAAAMSFLLCKLGQRVRRQVLHSRSSPSRDNGYNGYTGYGGYLVYIVYICVA